MTVSTVAERHLVWLNRANTNRALVGGKGASLSRLAAFGAPVPPAFALTTRAYDAFAQGLGLSRNAEGIDAAELSKLRDAIVDSPFPAQLSGLIASAWHEMRSLAGDKVVLAVRSSASAEDSASHSFAGQHDSILGVQSLPSLEIAIKQCWASLWSERAYAYRKAGNLGDAQPGIAVVVQQMIQSDVSFVAFTSDPVGTWVRHVVISATWGLGEALASGLVTPDHVVVAPDGEVVEYAVGDKHLMVIPEAEGGTREVPVPRALRGIPALSSAQASRIASLARALVPRLGYEADLEGAIASDTLYLFQARPITTLAPRILAERV
jgi:phosphoenolpyruvate synthase/pyruvate phosphate dikinase